MRRRASTESGFTLIEVLLVVVIIGILAAIVAPKLVGRSEDARIAAAQADLKSLSTALGMYELDNGFFPTTEQGLKALIEQPAGEPEPLKWKKYLDRNDLPNDPWGHEYVFKNPGEINVEGYDLFSVGKDGQEGTEDDVQRP